MALFDFLKSKEDVQSERVAELKQQIFSLQEELGSIEKKKEELLSQVEDLKNQKNEFVALKQDKEKLRKQVKKLQDTYDRLDKILKSSTKQVRGIPSSSFAPLVGLYDKYLISVDEEDFQELSRYYSLKEENVDFCEKKEQREKVLQDIKSKISDANKELVQLREDLVKQRDINHTP